MSTVLGVLAGKRAVAAPLIACGCCSDPLASAKYSLGADLLCATCALACGATLPNTPVPVLSSNAGLLASLQAGAAVSPGSLAARWSVAGPWYERLFRRHLDRVEHFVEKDGTVVMRFGPEQAVVRATPIKGGMSVSIAPPDHRPAAPHGELLFAHGSLLNDILSHGAQDSAFADVFCAPPHSNPLIALADRGCATIKDMVLEVAKLNLTPALIAEYVAANHRNESTSTGVAAALLKQRNGAHMLEQAYGSDAKRVLQSVDIPNAKGIGNLAAAVVVGHGSDATAPPEYHRTTATPSNTVVTVVVPTAAAPLLPSVLGATWERHGPVRPTAKTSTFFYTDIPKNQLKPYQLIGNCMARVQLAKKRYTAGEVIGDSSESFAWTTMGQANVGLADNDRKYRALVAIGASEPLVEVVGFGALDALVKKRCLSEDTDTLRQDVVNTLRKTVKRLTTKVEGYEWTLEDNGSKVELFFKAI
jgi:hypothetical protein